MTSSVWQHEEQGESYIATCRGASQLARTAGGPAAQERLDKSGSKDAGPEDALSPVSSAQVGSSSGTAPITAAVISDGCSCEY